jgi:hypothetical protein
MFEAPRPSNLSEIEILEGQVERKLDCLFCYTRLVWVAEEGGLSSSEVEVHT